MALSTIHAETGGRRPPKGQLIPFTPPVGRRFRRPLAEDETPGQILLFMGVRYERMPDPVPAPELPKRRRS